MYQQQFNVNLLGDVSIGSRGTIVGAKQGRSILPGSVFLGAAAARLYADLGQETAWTVFHSGKLRFHDALPLTSDDRVAYPMPKALHTEGKASIDTDPVKVFNFTQTHLENGRGLKEGFLTSVHQFYKPKTRTCLKTAIDPRTGRAAESQLFGLHAIAAGCRFRFCLAANDEVGKEIFARVVKSLTGQLRLGTSRSAEYGKVHLEPIQGQPLTHGAAQGDRLFLYCLADLACLDEWGQPTTHPTPQALGLPPGRLDLKRSFLAHDCLTPFNAKWQRTEQERQVISAGSVLCYKLDGEPNWPELVALAEHGLGNYRQLGLGQVQLNPPVLQDKCFHIQKCASPSAAAQPEQPNHPLAQWLLDRQLLDLRDREARDTAAEWLKSLKLCYASARLLASEQRGVRVGPSPSQWDRVRDLARDPALGDHPAKLHSALFGEHHPPSKDKPDDAVCKHEDPDWCKDILAQTEHGGLSHFRDWLREKLNTCKSHKATTLAHLARQAITLSRELEER